MSTLKFVGSRVLVGSSLVVAGLSACAIDEADEDGIDDDFVAVGEADSGIAEATPEAHAIVRVANLSSQNRLVTDIGVGPKAAGHMISFRSGEDGELGTHDDRKFHNLAELDAVRYVGPTAFRKLLTFAEARGYVAEDRDPFSADPTGQPIAILQEIIDQVPAGQTYIKVGRYQMFEQERHCGSSGCSAWQDTTSLVFTTTGHEPAVTFENLPLGGDVYLSVRDADIFGTYAYVEFQGDPLPDGNRFYGECYVGWHNGFSSCLHGVASSDFVADKHSQSGQDPITYPPNVGILHDGAVNPFVWNERSGFLTPSRIKVAGAPRQELEEYQITGRVGFSATW